MGTGKIIKIAGGRIIEKAKGDIIYNSGGDIINTAAGKILQTGKEGGVTFGDYEPPLEVIKIDGPFDDKGKKISVIKKEVFYTYKVVQFSREPREDELKNLRWGTRIGKQKILWDYPVCRGKKSVRFAVPQEIKASSFTVYAYVNMAYAGMNSSYVTAGIEKFYYKGEKSWGKLQTGFAAEYKRITEEEIKANTNKTGLFNINKMKTRTLKQVKESYEGLLLGVRRVLSDEIEEKVINNFYYGKGKKLSFDENTRLSKDLKEYGPFQEYFANYLEVIKYMLRERTIQTKDREDIKKIFTRELNFSAFPNFNQPWHIPDYDFYGLMGGTQTIKIEVEIEEDEPEKYWINTKMYIGDWYGADWGDVNGAVKGSVHSLTAFFWLQHYYGCRPFETEIIYKSLDYIKL